MRPKLQVDHLLALDVGDRSEFASFYDLLEGIEGEWAAAKKAEVEAEEAQGAGAAKSAPLAATFSEAAMGMVDPKEVKRVLSGLGEKLDDPLRSVLGAPPPVCKDVLPFDFSAIMDDMLDMDVMILLDMAEVNHYPSNAAHCDTLRSTVCRFCRTHIHSKIIAKKVYTILHC